MNRTIRRIALGALGATALGFPAASSAHVTLQPNEAPAGAYVVENVRVPNESDTESTVKVDMQLPDGFAFASYEPKAGWKVEVKREKLATPVKTDDGELTEQVTRITWTGDGKEGSIAPGQFMDFPLSMRIPGKAGDELTFKVLQTYSGGKVSRWIGAPDSDEPAPVVKVTAPQADHHGGGAKADDGRATTTTTADSAVAPAAAAGTDDDDDSDGNTLGIIAIALGRPRPRRRRPRADPDEEGCSVSNDQTKAERKEQRRTERAATAASDAQAQARKRRLQQLGGVLIAAAVAVAILVVVSSSGTDEGPAKQAGESVAGQAEVAERFAGIPQDGTGAREARRAGDPRRVRRLPVPVLRAVRERRSARAGRQRGQGGHAAYRVPSPGVHR